MEWWVWIGLALFFLLAELFAPGGFFLVFFGLGALVVGLLPLCGVVLGGAIDWGVFIVVSLLSLALFRNRLLGSFSPGPGMADQDSIIGTRGVADDEIRANGSGRMLLRGTSWNATNIGSVDIGKGKSCIVKEVDGLTLKIVADR